MTNVTRANLENRNPKQKYRIGNRKDIEKQKQNGQKAQSKMNDRHRNENNNNDLHPVHGFLVAYPSLCRHSIDRIDGPPASNMRCQCIQHHHINRLPILLLSSQLFLGLSLPPSVSLLDASLLVLCCTRRPYIRLELLFLLVPMIFRSRVGAEELTQVAPATFAEAVGIVCGWSIGDACGSAHVCMAETVGLGWG